MRIDGIEETENVDSTIEQEQPEQIDETEPEQKASFMDKLKGMFSHKETDEAAEQGDEVQEGSEQSAHDAFLDRLRVTPEQLEEGKQRVESEKQKMESQEGASEASDGDGERSLENDALHRRYQHVDPSLDPYSNR